MLSIYEEKINIYFEIKGVPDSSRESYTRRIAAFAEHIQRQGGCLESVVESDIQQYILHLKNDKRLAPGTINNYISAIRVFYVHILKREWEQISVPRMKKVTKFPIIPPREDILAIIDATENLKHKAFLSLMYGSGLRVGEVAKLKIGDICSKSMRIRVDNAKHGTNRYTILSVATLDVLRKYFVMYFFNTRYKLDDWLFKGREHGTHVSVRTIKNTLLNLRNRLDLEPGISSHTLRHCFATHSLEDGVDPVFIQQLLGHKSLLTTRQYLHMTSKSLMGIKSPLDTFNGDTV